MKTNLWKKFNQNSVKPRLTPDTDVSFCRKFAGVDYKGFDLISLFWI